MKPIRFEFNSVHEESLIISLGAFLNVPPVNGSITVPAPFGDGIVVRKELDEGLVLVCWNFQLNADVIFAKQLSPLDKEGRSFIINYLVSAEEIEMECPLLNKKFVLRGGLNILLLPDDADLDFHLSSGSPVKVASVSVKPGWLKKEYAGQEPAFREYIDKLLAAEKPSVFIESSTMEEFKMLGNILNNAGQVPKGIPGLKPRIMTVIADFFARIFEKPVTEITESRILHFSKMQSVEDILKKHLEKELPDIEWIARQVTLSISTLKRHFKIVYGKGVYEYYLELKMEYAKRLLLETDLSVNQVAYRLNYEKPSSFIGSFKKQHGCSPGILRKMAS